MKRLCIILLAVMGLAGAGFASPASVSVQLTGVGGASQGGVYVVPYYLDMNGNVIWAMCDDFSHDVSKGESWQATVTTFSNLGATRWGLQDAQQYAEAAWLYNQWLANSSQAGNINFAIWALFTPSTSHMNGFTTSGADSALWWDDQALAWFDGGGAKNFNFSGFEIITPLATGANSPQEYITKLTATVAEPPSLLLLGSGLFGLGLVMRRRLTSA